MGEEPAHIVVAAVEEGVGLVFIERAHLLAFAAHQIADNPFGIESRLESGGNRFAAFDVAEYHRSHGSQVLHRL